MNILPHKSWHVYNKSNIERVRRDEAKAKEEEDKKLERQQIAASILPPDREARLQMLRDRASKRLGQGTSTEGASDTHQSLVPTTPTKHINFWEELETGGGQSSGHNPEAEADKKAEKEKWEKQITMYLDKGAKDPVPWYAATRRISDDKQDDSEFEKVYQKLDNPKEKRKALTKRKREIRDVEREDPLSVVRTSLKERSSQSGSHSSHRHADERKHKKEKHRHSKNHSSSSSSKSIEQLREERIERERAERQRTSALLRGSKEGDTGRQQAHKYNSQFNPDDTDKAHQRHRRTY